MDNPNNYELTSDFSSSGNDTSATIILNVPSHSIPSGQDAVFTQDAIVGDSFYGRQLRAQIQPSGLPNAKNVPSPYVMMLVQTVAPAGRVSNVMSTVSRVSRNTVRLTVTSTNSGFPAATITLPAFTVTARVRTVVAN